MGQYGYRSKASQKGGLPKKAQTTPFQKELNHFAPTPGTLKLDREPVTGQAKKKGRRSK